MMPVACAALWFGKPWIEALIALLAAVMGWEWARLVGRAGTRAEGWLIGAACGLPVLLAGIVSMAWGLGAAIVLAVGQQALAGSGPRRPLWTIAGLLWIVLASIAFLWLRERPGTGFAIAVWVVAVVWSVDVAAYAAGRTVGGPKLAPRISPNKTWSGLAGGVVAAMAAGAVVGAVLPLYPLPMMVSLSAALAVVEQMGDMAESYAKRRFGVKDSSHLIPGHGGLLDRLDGMLAVVAAVFVIVAAG
jgi:phosphatidate cytidylyltransferase